MRIKLYLTQIAKWLEFQTGIPQQIISTGERADIRYTDHDSSGDAMHMTIIADADIDIESISWSGEHGLGLNTDVPDSKNGEKVHVILWTDSETAIDDRGRYMDAEGALNGVLVIQNPEIKVTGDVIREMLAIRDILKPLKIPDKPSVMQQISDAGKPAGKPSLRIKLRKPRKEERY